MQITESKRYVINKLFPDAQNAARLTVYVSGAGSIEIEFKNGHGDYVLLENGSLNVPGQYTIDSGYGAFLYANVSGVSETAPLNLDVCKLS